MYYYLQVILLQLFISVSGTESEKKNRSLAPIQQFLGTTSLNVLGLYSIYAKWLFPYK